MKYLFLISVCIAYVLTPATMQAQVIAPLGKANFEIKFDYIVFTDGYFDNFLNQDDGIYVGIEGYGYIAQNIYLGGEVGQGVNMSLSGEEINFVPIEINAKYTRGFASNFVIDFGAGFSYSYAELTNQISNSEVREDWLFGGQIFIDLSYRIKWFSIGVNTKYQITQSFKEEDLDLSNFRLGVQIGIII